MIEEIQSGFKVLTKASPAKSSDIEKIKGKYVVIPEDYIETVMEATEIEIRHSEWKVIRIWGPLGCIEMDEAHGISDYIKGSFPIGDDEGGRAIIYMEGNKGWGLYLCDFSTIDIDEALFIAPSLRELLCEGIGIDVF